MPRSYSPRINSQIRISPVRVVRDGEQLGVMPTSAALRLAQDDGLDLVEIAPTARPPVCHILDYGKFRYEQSIKEKENRKKQKVTQDKEIRLSPVVEEHDLVTKVNQARTFLNEGKRVQFSLRFKGRLIVHKDIGFDVVARVLDKLNDVATVDLSPRMEGKSIIFRVVPKKTK